MIPALLSPDHRPAHIEVETLRENGSLYLSCRRCGVPSLQVIPQRYAAGHEELLVEFLEAHRKCGTEGGD